jgi:hypothetical protein
MASYLVIIKNEIEKRERKTVVRSFSCGNSPTE